MATSGNGGIDLNEVLAKVIIEGTKGFGDKLKQIVQEILDKNKYGITPTTQESKELWKISNSERFLRLEDCIGDHWALKLLNIGIYISNLNDAGVQKDIIERIKKTVYDDHKSKGVKVLTISTTGVISNIIDYLSQLKIRKDLSQTDIGAELDKIIDQWERMTIFVKGKGEDTQKRIHNLIVAYMEIRLPLFFVFAYGSASKLAYTTIADMNVLEIIRDHGYMFFTGLKRDGYGLEVYSWNFELFETNLVI